MRIESYDRTVDSVLKMGFFFIPRFQRPYSWDRDEITEFWNDTMIDRNNDYFIGSMVVYNVSPNIFGVVDGQQRLTTIIMTLCKIRDYFDKYNFTDLADGIQSLIERKDINNKDNFVLTTETSFPYLQNAILNHNDDSLSYDIKDEEKTLRKAYERIEGFIDDELHRITSRKLNIDKEADAVKPILIDLRDRLLELSLILISLDTEDDAYTIFETMNTRGKELTVADLVKNRLMSMLKSDNTNLDSAKIRWSQVVECIESDDSELTVEQFLLHYWLSKFKNTSKRSLFKLISKHLTAANASLFLDDLVLEAGYYRHIHDTSQGKWTRAESQLERSLDAIHLFKVKLPIPMLLATYREYKQGRIKLSAAKRVFKAIECFHFVFTAVTSQRSSGGITQRYVKSALELGKATDANRKGAIIADFIADLKTVLPSFDEFAASFREIHYTKLSTRRKALVQYILGYIYEDNNPKLPVNLNLLTIEHILPQSTKGYAPDVIGQIGNLIAVTAELNSNDLQDKLFTSKRRIFDEHNIGYDSIIEDASEWDASAISKRTEYLADLAYKKIWALKR